MKQCNRCKEHKPSGKEYFRPNANFYVRPICRACENEYIQEEPTKTITTLPPFDDRQSAINQIENLNHNPKFFHWLCTGTNQNFIP